MDFEPFENGRYRVIMPSDGSVIHECLPSDWVPPPFPFSSPEHADEVVREDIEGDEAWRRLTHEPDIRGVEAIHNDVPAGWQVTVWAMEFVRAGDALYDELRQAIESAIWSVSGTASVERQDTEVWWVTGSPSGEQLTGAVAAVLDERAGRLRDRYNRLG